MLVEASCLRRHEEVVVGAEVINNVRFDNFGHNAWSGSMLLKGRFVKIFITKVIYMCNGLVLSTKVADAEG